MKTLAYGDANLQAEVLLLWKGIAADERNARLLRQAKEREEEMTEKMKRQKLAAVEKCFANEGRALMATNFRAWKAEVEAGKLARKLKDRSMDATLRRILSSNEQIAAMCLAEWKGDTLNERQLKELAAAEERKKKVQEARQKALAFFEQSLTANINALLLNCVNAFVENVQAEKDKRKRKDEVMKSALRGIASSEEVLKSMTFTLWQKVYDEERAL